MLNIGDILDFNFAEEIQEEWDGYMEEGYTIPDATTQIMEQYADVLEEKEEILLYATLGFIQAELEQIDPRVKEEVGEILGTKHLEECLADTKECKRMLQLLKKRCR